jgi:protein-S-isoprenylcysteine O-methyltransferase Ste14
VLLYDHPWLWVISALLFATGIELYIRARVEFSPAQLRGVPELRGRHQDQRLVTSGIRARVRHPVYLAHLCEMLAWSVGTGLVVCFGLTAFAILTGGVMIRMEEAELEQRFGEAYREYRERVPAVVPRLR